MLLKQEEITATYNSPKAKIDANITLCEQQQARPKRIHITITVINN